MPVELKNINFSQCKNEMNKFCDEDLNQVAGGKEDEISLTFVSTAKDNENKAYSLDDILL